MKNRAFAVASLEGASRGYGRFPEVVVTASKPDMVKASLTFANYFERRAEWEARMGNMCGERAFLEQAQAAVFNAIGWASR